jgi:pantoate--beta-alanine ligase
VYLSPAERDAAASLSAGLRAAADAYAAGERDQDKLRGILTGGLDAEPLVNLEYAELVDPATFHKPGNLAVLAARVGKSRLIDNHDLALPFPG